MYSSQDRDIHNWERISVQDYLHSFLDELSEREGNRVILNTDFQVMRIAGLLGPDASLYFKSLQTFHNRFTGWTTQEIKFTASNLGWGYLAYFVCNRCAGKAKFLYYGGLAGHMEQPLCRKCLGLKYRQPGRKQRRFSRLLNKPYLSSEHKWQIIKDAEITVQDVIGSGLNKPP